MTRLLQNSFVSGILSPSLHGRSDLKAYYTGLADAENFIVTKEGTLKKRPALRYANWSPSVAARLFPYRFDRTQGGFLAVWRNGNNLMMELRDKTGTVKASSQTLHAGESPLSDAAFKAIHAVQIGDVLYITSQEAGFFKKATIGWEDGTLAVTNWQAATRPGAMSSIRAVPSGFDHSSDGHTKSIQYCALRVVDGVQETITSASARVDYDSWPAGAKVTVTTTLKFAQVSGEAQADALTRVTNGEIFDRVAIGKKDGGSSYGKIAEFYPEDVASESATASLSNSATSGMWTITFTFTDNNITPGEQISEQTDILGDGFAAPLCVECFQQRLVFANASTRAGAFPMTLWFSEAGNLSNFRTNRPTVDSDAFSPTIASRGPAFIRWMAAYQESLVLFTDSGLWTVGFTQTSAFGATTCRISQFSDIVPHPDIEPVSTPAGLIFVAADARKVYSVNFDVQENALKPIDRTAFAAALTESAKITSIALQQYPDSVAWVVLSDGSMIALTFEKEQEVFAWTRHTPCAGWEAETVFSIGSVTETAAGAETDVLLVLRNSTSGARRLVRMAKAYMKDSPEGTAEADIAAWMRTLPLESQDSTLAALRKNVKSTAIRAATQGDIHVRKAQGDIASAWPWETARVSQEIYKAVPKGCVDEEGRFEVKSGEGACEIKAIIQNVEFLQ